MKDKNIEKCINALLIGNLEEFKEYMKSGADINAKDK